MPPSTEKLCRLHLETVVALLSRQFIENWLKETDVTIAEPYTGAEPTQEAAPIQEQPKSKRGRRPGAATDEVRCTWGVLNKGRCKNTKQEGSDYCKMHVTKAALIAATPNGVSSSS